MLTLVPAALLAAALPLAARAAPAVEEVPRTGLLPTLRLEAGALDTVWTPAGHAWRSPVTAFEGGGHRVGVLLSAPLEEALLVEARAVDEAGAFGPWLPVEETWR